MLYREAGQFKSSYAADAAIFPIRQDRIGMAVVLAVFLGFTWVALRSERFWPLWVAGLQLTAIFGHVLKAIDVDLFSRAYAAALVFWAYPMLLILALGTWRGRRRRANRGAAA